MRKMKCLDTHNLRTIFLLRRRQFRITLAFENLNPHENIQSWNVTNSGERRGSKRAQNGLGKHIQRAREENLA